MQTLHLLWLIATGRRQEGSYCILTSLAMHLPWLLYSWFRLLLSVSLPLSFLLLLLADVYFLEQSICGGYINTSPWNLIQSTIWLASCIYFISLHFWFLANKDYCLCILEQGMERGSSTFSIVVVRWWRWDKLAVKICSSERLLQRLDIRISFFITRRKFVAVTSYFELLHHWNSRRTKRLRSGLRDFKPAQ